jgi:hypothetical protein
MTIVRTSDAMVGSLPWWFEGFAQAQQKSLDTVQKRWSLQWLWSDLGEHMRWQADQAEHARQTRVMVELGA